MAKSSSAARSGLGNAFSKLGQKEGLNTTFTTFLELCAHSLSILTSPVQYEERVNRYENMTSKMSDELRASYSELIRLLGETIVKNTDDPIDILGSVYHELNLNNEWNGQFFTPNHICNLMAKLINPSGDWEVNESGYVKIMEPACGSGAMIIAAISEMQREDFDYRRKSLFIAKDIDIRCVWMTYIQLCLYDVPAIVIHGNSLTDEEWSEWITPNATILLSKTNERQTKDGDVNV